MAMIEVESIRKIFRGGRGLDAFSLRLERNELVGLVGPNGAGKSTLIKILSTLLSADSGAALGAAAGHFADPRSLRVPWWDLPSIVCRRCPKSVPAVPPDVVLRVW